MFGLGVPELIIILIIVVVFFGAKKLPGIGTGLGEGITNFKNAMVGKKEKQEEVASSEEKNDKEKTDS